MSEITTLAYLIKNGELDGYRTYTPHGLCEDIDRSVAEDNPCDLCGGACTYRGFRCEDSYRAFAVCTACGHAMEF